MNPNQSVIDIHSSNRFRRVASMLLYLDDVGSVSARNAIKIALDTYLEENHRKMQWSTTPSGQISKFSFDQPQLKSLTEGPVNRDWEFYAHSGLTFVDAADYSIAVLLQADWSTNKGYLRLNWPFAGLQDSPEMFLRKIANIAIGLPVEYGWAGPAVALSFDEFVNYGGYHELWQILPCNPGLMVDDPVCHLALDENKLPCPAWISILSESYIAEMGLSLSQDELTDVRIEQMGGLTLLVTGDEPCLARNITDKGYDGYRQVHCVIAPSQNNSESGFLISAGSSTEDIAASKAWLNRFAVNGSRKIE